MCALPDGTCEAECKCAFLSLLAASSTVRHVLSSSLSCVVCREPQVVQACMYEEFI